VARVVGGGGWCGRRDYCAYGIAGCQQNLNETRAIPGKYG